MATRSDIDLVLSSLDEFEDIRRVPEATALWDVNVVVDRMAPVRLLVDNGINEIYVQAILRDPLLDANPGLLLEVLQNYGVVGLSSLGGDSVSAEDASSSTPTSMRSRTRCSRSSMPTTTTAGASRPDRGAGDLGAT